VTKCWVGFCQRATLHHTQADTEPTVSNLSQFPLKVLSAVADQITQDGSEREAGALREVLRIATDSPNYGGMGLLADNVSAEDEVELLLLVSACKSNTCILCLCLAKH
jgi:hypothetical protein